MQVRLISITKPEIDDCETAEELIAYCARVSNPTNQANAETAPRLLRYLAKHRHWSPFEMVSMTLEITTTRDIARQILRHRSFSFQEFSQRYSDASSPLVLREVRLQDHTNRQASHETDDPELADWWASVRMRLHAEANLIYAEALKRGVAKEVARAVLPEGLTVSRMYMAGTVRSWIHYCQLRTGPETQKEHRLVAEECKRILLGKFPTLSELMEAR